jgi:beta-phosphoglucomutase
MLTARFSQAGRRAWYESGDRREPTHAMIRLMIFDLDGTLLQTERLKALSYARAAVLLSEDTVSEDKVIDAYSEVMGHSRREVATTLLRRFHLEKPARTRMQEFGVTTPWQAFVHLRLTIYDQMIANPEIIRANQWPHNVALLEQARAGGCKTALATMSRCETVQRILEVLDWTDKFDFVAAHDDIEHGKPDPEIYRLVSQELDVPPSECLVIEDSVSGVTAALAAGMRVIAVTTQFTRRALHEAGLLEERWIVDDPGRVVDVASEVMGHAT